jgi:hypothetical protein
MVAIRIGRRGNREERAKVNRKGETKGKGGNKRQSRTRTLSLKEFFERTNPEADVRLVKRLRDKYRHLLHFHPAALG